MKHKFPTTLAAAAVALASQSAAATPVSVFNGSGNLVGADGVTVDGSLYDVRFASGSCDSLFGCADGSSFVISPADAAAAGQAILDFVKDAYAASSPTSRLAIAGCANVVNRCDILTPFSVAAGAVSVEDSITYFSGQSTVALQSLQTETIPSDRPASNVNAGAYAVWTREAVATSIPEPASTALVAVGLAAAASSLRKRRVD